MVLSSDYTFQLADTGVLLNNDASSSVPFVDIDKISGLDSAPYRETERDHEGVDGGFLDAEFEKGRPVVLEGTAFADVTTLLPYLDTIKANWAPSTTPIPLYLYAPGVGERIVFVKPRGVRYDWEQALRTGTSRIQLVAYAEDPRIYSSALQSVVIPLGATITTGFSFSYSFSFSFGATSSATDGAYVTNSGNRPAPAILTITGPVVNPVVVNDNTSSTLSFNITLTSTDVLVVDLVNHTVVLNGTANRRGSLLVSDWFLLAVGSNFIRYRAESGSGTTLTVSWRSAWR